MTGVRVLWLRPSRGEHISVRRERVAEHLEEAGFEIDIQNASGVDAIAATRRAVGGNYDLVVGNVRIGLYLGFPLARLLRKPFVGTVSDPLSDIDHLPGPIYRLLTRYEWAVLSRAEGCSFVYESSYREARRRGIEHAVRLPNAVDYERFADPDDAIVQEAREHLEGVSLDRPVAIYLGVLAPHYEIEAILSAATDTPEWEFVFVGEGELEPVVREAAETHENVHFPGAFPYRLMPGFLAHADVGFCFKDAEQPLKLKEYGAAGLATIVQPGRLEAFYDSDELVFVEPEGEAIAGTLESLNSEQLGAYGERLRERASEASWAEIAAGFRDLFEAAISHEPTEH